MSWIIQSLLNNKNFIHEKGDIDSDEYNDLLIVEKKIKELTAKNLLSSEDLYIIDEMSGDIPGFESKPKSQKETEYKKYFSICNRIAYYMGGYFTDDGYLEHMKRKHKLNDEQVDILRVFINSKYKHKIVRKGRYDVKSYSQGIDNE